MVFMLHPQITTRQLRERWIIVKKSRAQIGCNLFSGLKNICEGWELKGHVLVCGEKPRTTTRTGTMLRLAPSPLDKVDHREVSGMVIPKKADDLKPTDSCVATIVLFTALPDQLLLLAAQPHSVDHHPLDAPHVSDIL